MSDKQRYSAHKKSIKGDFPNRFHFLCPAQVVKIRGNDKCSTYRINHWEQRYDADKKQMEKGLIIYIHATKLTQFIYLEHLDFMCWIIIFFSNN